MKTVHHNILSDRGQKNNNRTSQKETTEDVRGRAKEDTEKGQMGTKPKWTGGVEGERKDRKRQRRTKKDDRTEQEERKNKTSGGEKGVKQMGIGD